MSKKSDSAKSYKDEKHLYDSINPWSIERHAKCLLNKRLRDVLDDEQLTYLDSKLSEKRKGHLGEIIEEYIFNKSPDHISQPDFPDAGVELKTTPLKRHDKKKYVAKERLVFQMIDFNTIIKETWEESSFLKKNSLFLLMMYLYEKDKSLLDYRFKIIRLVDMLKDLPKKDVQVIKSDWEKIVAKIKEGKAHLLSEGDTFYLGACTKGSSARDTTTQPRSAEPAKRRAFSFKSSYMNNIIVESLSIAERNAEPLLLSEETDDIEKIVLERFEPYLGMSVEEIISKTGLEINMARKDRYAVIARAMLGIKKRRIEEFEKADIALKIIRLRKKGMPKEAMSFPAIIYKEIVNEDWYESRLYRRLEEKKYLFVVFQHGERDNLFLKNVMFWNMPHGDIEEAKKVWDETIRRIKAGSAHDLPKASESPVCHVRPHGRDSSDKILTPTGEYVVKKSFWLNASYIKEQIEKYSV